MTPRESLELHVPEPEPPRRSGCFGWLALVLVWVLCMEVPA